MVTRLGSKGVMVGTKWANSCSGCMNGLRKHYSHLLRGCKGPWVLNRSLSTKKPTIACLLMVGMVKVTSLQVCILWLKSALGFISFQARAQTEMKIVLLNACIY